MKVSIYSYPNSRRSHAIAQAMATGVSLEGDKPSMINGVDYREPVGDVAVFYGLIKHVMKGYEEAGRKYVYVDLGYWGRHEGGRRHGYHKVSVNSRHPTAYFQKIPKKPDRFNRFRIKVHPWRERSKNGFIMLAGMSKKAAEAEGFAAEEWETKAVEAIRKVSNRRIVYRPKPNWPDFRHLEGTSVERGSDAPGDVCNFLKDCHAVVTHHSNVAVDALLFGVPTFVCGGAASPLSSRHLSGIEEPVRLDGREQWAADLAYTQWSVAEMIEGKAWQYLKDEGLV